MWEDGLAQGGFKCNIEFKMCRYGGQQFELEVGTSQKKSVLKME